MQPARGGGVGLPAGEHGQQPGNPGEGAEQAAQLEHLQRPHQQGRPRAGPQEQGFRRGGGAEAQPHHEQRARHRVVRAVSYEDQADQGHGGDLEQEPEPGRQREAAVLDEGTGRGGGQGRPARSHESGGARRCRCRGHAPHGAPSQCPPAGVRPHRCPVASLRAAVRLSTQESGAAGADPDARRRQCSWCRRTAESGRREDLPWSSPAPACCSPPHPCCCSPGRSSTRRSRPRRRRSTPSCRSTGRRGWWRTCSCSPAWSRSGRSFSAWLGRSGSWRPVCPCCPL